MAEEGVGGIFTQLQAYIETRLRLAQFRVLDQLTKIIGQLILLFILLVVGLIVVFLCNVALAIWIGQLLGQFYWGIFAVASIDILFGLLLYLFRQMLIIRPLRNSWTRMLLASK